MCLLTDGLLLIGPSKGFSVRAVPLQIAVVFGVSSRSVSARTAFPKTGARLASKKTWSAAAPDSSVYERAIAILLLLQEEVTPQWHEYIRDAARTICFSEGRTITLLGPVHIFFPGVWELTVTPKRSVRLLTYFSYTTKGLQDQNPGLI